MLLQILRFTLPSSLTISCPAFLSIRQEVAIAGATAQYFGYSVQTRVASLPKKRHEITWIMQWPQRPGLFERPHLSERFTELSQDAVSLLVDLDDSDGKKVLKALEAPICEVVAMRMRADAPLQDPPLSHSMHKTYTDCYRMQGFTGGDWGYAVNTNSIGGESIGVAGSRLDSQQRRLAIYLLGWESIELHEDAGKTAIFAEEMDKLGPWVDQGSGAWYVTLRK
ncbi:hypothetical protein ACJZ2D_006545 [Fusarium nematophilum]